jgi:transposase
MGFDLLEGAYDTRQCIRVLDGLGHQLDHRPVTVIWDNLGAHHAGDLHAWAATQPWLELAYLPSYAPELDPVEGLWANLKGLRVGQPLLRRPRRADRHRPGRLDPRAS